MATGLPTSTPVFVRLAAAFLAALFQVAFLVAAEPNQGSTVEQDSTLAGAEEGTEPLLAVDESAEPEAGQPSFRTWTDVSGQYRTEAAFLGFENGQVRLEKRDGSITTVAMERLSDLDQQYVKSQTPLEEVAVEPSEETGMEVEEDAEPAVESPDVEAGLVPATGSGGIEQQAIADEPSEADPEPAESPIGESSHSLETAGGEEKTGAVQPAVADEPASQPEPPQPVGSQPASETGMSPVIIVGVVAGAILIVVIVVWGVTRRRRRAFDVLDFRQ